MTWINWKTIATSGASLIILGAGTLGVQKTRAEWTGYRAVCAQVQELAENQQQMQAQQKILQQISRDIAALKIASATVTGNARVRGNGGDVYMVVNQLGKAENYAKEKRARVTNLSSEDSPSIVVSITGTFRNTDENYLVQLSTKAGDRLGIAVGTVAKVRLEPVGETGK